MISHRFHNNAMEILLPLPRGTEPQGAELPIAYCLLLLLFGYQDTDIPAKQHHLEMSTLKSNSPMKFSLGNTAHNKQVENLGSTFMLRSHLKVICLSIFHLSCF